MRPRQSCLRWFMVQRKQESFSPSLFPGTSQHHKNQYSSNYRRNLPDLTGVPTMALVWLTELFSSVPMTKPLAQ